MLSHDPDYRQWIALAADHELAFHSARLAVTDTEQKARQFIELSTSITTLT